MFVQNRRRIRDRGGVDRVGGDGGRGRARSKSAGRDARARGLRARDPGAGATAEPTIATRATEKPARAWKKTRAQHFRSADIGVLERGADPGSVRTGLSPIFRALNSSADSTILTILNVRVWVCAWHAGLE